uniref:Uncharacterized protein n=1 Tax=Parascaris univalens TaxID=6257 RepID=A0A915B9L0_PARUN
MVDDGDTEMISEKSDTEEGDIAEASTTLEKAAADRKRRLMNMKAQMRNVDRAENEETGSSNENATIRTFRSYDPLAVNLGEKGRC